MSLSKPSLRRLKISALILVTPLALLVALVVYLSVADLGLYKGLVERSVSKALGRELIISGRFEPRFSLHPELFATEISLANPSWSASPTMLNVGELRVKVSLLSLLNGPILIESLEINGARVATEKAMDGKASWDFDLPNNQQDKPTHSNAKQHSSMPVVLEHLDIRDASYRHQEKQSGSDITVTIENFSAHLDDRDYAVASVLGEIEGETVSLTGEIGPFDNLLNASQVGMVLAGQLGPLQIDTHGKVKHLANLDGLYFTALFSIDDIDRAATTFDMPSFGPGKLHIEARIEPTAKGLGQELALDAIVGTSTARLEGGVDNFFKPKAVDLNFVFSVPELDAIAELIDVALPTGGFSASGQFLMENGDYRFNSVRLATADSALQLDGVLGAWPGLDGTDLDFTLNGRSLASYASALAVPLADRPFSADGKLLWQDQQLKLIGVGATVGDNILNLDGHLSGAERFIGSQLTLKASGPNIADIPMVAERENLPPKAFRILANAEVVQAGYKVEDCQLDIGDTQAAISGLVGFYPDWAETQVQVSVNGQDLSQLEPYLRLGRLPVAGFSAEGSVRRNGENWLLEDVQAGVADAHIQLSAKVTGHSELIGSGLTMQFNAPHLSVFDALVAPRILPDLPLTLSSRIKVTREGYEFSATETQLGEVKATLGGTLGPLPNFYGSNFEAEITTQNLQSLQGFIPEHPLPAIAASASGDLLIDQRGYHLKRFKLKQGESELTIDGKLGQPPTWQGTSLSLNASGKDFSEVAQLAGITAPKESFSLQGGLTRDAQHTQLKKISFLMGDYRLDLDGVLGDLPQFIGTKLDMQAQGADLKFVADLLGLDEPLPNLPFTLSGHFAGTSELLMLEKFAASLGNSNLSGALSMDLAAKPVIEGQVHSDYLDLNPFLRTEPQPLTQTTATGKVKQKEKQLVKPKYVISDAPLDLSSLQSANAKIQYTGGHTAFKNYKLTKLDFNIDLQEGNLTLSALDALTLTGGSVQGSAKLMTLANGYSIDIDMLGEQFLLLGDIAGGVDINEQPLSDLVVKFQGQGISLHDIAAGSNGRIEVVTGSGKINNSSYSLFTDDILLKLLTTLNPFIVKETHTNNKCSIFVASIEQGIASLEPLLFTTDKIIILGKGEVNLRNEKLDVSWNTKSQTGLGVSASTLVNPYIRLGGTLSNPAIGFKPIDGAVSTGIAVATGGLSILGKGLWERTLGKVDYCKKIRQQLGYE